MEDRLLVKRILKRDRSAFRTLISEHRILVGHMIGRLVDDPLEREELVQDVFLKIYEKISTFKFNSSLGTWIGSIAYRTSINHLKKKKRIKAEVDIDHIEFELGDMDETYEKKDFSIFIHNLIDKMPPQYKMVLMLFYIDGYSYPEIVEMTDMPEGTVKNYLFRAKEKLKKLAIPYLGKEIEIE